MYECGGAHPTGQTNVLRDEIVAPSDDGDQRDQFRDIRNSRRRSGRMHVLHQGPSLNLLETSLSP